MILVYTAFFTPVAIFFMRSFFLAIPRELEEAAMVDGCTRFGAFLRIVLPTRRRACSPRSSTPSCSPGTSCCSPPRSRSTSAETIPIGIRNFIGNYTRSTHQLMAAGVVSTMPVIIAFFATQRWLVRGLTAGAVKG